MDDVAPLLRAAAGAAVFRRGLALARGYGVVDHARTGAGASGSVRGSDGAYTTEVRVSDDGVAGFCTCVAQMSMPVCKHMVALALVAFGEAAPEGPGLAEMAASLPHDLLARLVVERADRDPALRARVQTLWAARRGTVDAKALRSAVTAATTAPRDATWRAGRDAAARAAEAVDLVRGLVDAGSPAAVPLAEHLIGRVDRLLSRVDDSGGYLGAVHHQVRDLHVAACAAAPPRPEDLAATLVKIACTTDWDWVEDAPERYRDILGTDGLTALDAAIARALARESSRPDPGEWGGESHATFTLRHMTVSAARAGGDVDRLVAVLAQDLTHALRYVHIAQALEDGGREREALMWLERGVAAHGTGDTRLRHALLAAYTRDGAHEDALAVARDHLHAHPTAAAFTELREVCPPDRWPDQRRDALARIATAGPDEHALALLADDDLPSALHVAQAPVRQSTHLTLARAAARTHPDAALRHYRPLLDEHLRGTGRRSYRQACAVLAEMHSTATAHGRPREVMDIAWHLRQEHRRRPALVEMLDALGWW